MPSSAVIAAVKRSRRPFSAPCLALGSAAVEIDAISASANGSYAADHEEAAALADVFGSRVPVPAVTAIKSVTGELLGAAGPLQIISMLEAMRAAVACRASAACATPRAARWRQR